MHVDRFNIPQLETLIQFLLTCGFQKKKKILKKKAAFLTSSGFFQFLAIPFNSGIFQAGIVTPHYIKLRTLMGEIKSSVRWDLSLLEWRPLLREMGIARHWLWMCHANDCIILRCSSNVPPDAAFHWLTSDL
jgi:hypothetical protein